MCDALYDLAVEIKTNLAQIEARIARAAERSGRARRDIRLIGVSKRQPLARLEAAWAAGLRAFGENYAQELGAKAGHPPLARAEWHFIGHLQRNKVKLVLPYATWIHGLDCVALAEVIERRATKPISCLMEVNIAGEPNKHGVAPDDVTQLVEALQGCSHVQLKGLMCMPPPVDTPETNRPHFHRLATLAKTLGLAELSMGMSDDFEMAIEEGATMVRIGTAIFGDR